MADAAAVDGTKPAVLIIGGLALYIHRNGLASEVRLVDKVLPQLAWLAAEFAEACSQDKFMQADASREQSLPKIFTPVHATRYTYVFNCGGETRYSQDDSVYASRSTALALTLAAECARRSIPAFVELSTGKVYKPPSSSTIAAGGCTETAPVKPWLKLAKHKLYAEEGLERLAREGSDEKGRLQYVILRLAHVYGEYDKGFLARGLCLARVYQARNEELKWLYGKNLRINTVHVHDACSAAWAAAVWCAANPITSAWSIPPNSSSPTIPAPPTSPTSPTTPATHTPTAEAISRIFNIVDEGDTSQADLANIISATFHMKTGFQNALINAFAKFNLESVVDDVNEEVLQPWADLLAEKGIVRAGPIGPWMEKELLKDCNLCLNAEKAKHTLGWSVGPDTRKLREEAVNDVVESYRRMGWWP